MNATQIFLKPGRYHTGGGKFHEFTADDLKQSVENTRKMMADGNHVPVLLEHADPGSDDGAPRDKRAKQVKHGAGWLADLAIGDDGSASHTLDIGDTEIAQKIERGEIKFTSPEFRPSWTDGKGRTYQNVITHVALTHKPRNTDQTELAENVALAIQFSLDEYEPIQMADDDNNETPPAAPSEKPADDAAPENPDVTGSGDLKKAQQFEAVRALLKECTGIDLPADSDSETFVRDLLAGLKTLKSAKEQAEQDAANNPPENPDTVQVESDVMQYSLADVTAEGFGDKKLAKICQFSADATRGKLEKLVEEKRLSPAVRDALLAREGVLQFSDEGDLVSSLTLDDVAAILAEQPVNLQFANADVEVESEHPEGHSFFSPDGSNELKGKDAEKYAEQVAQRNPGLFAQPAKA